MLFNVIIFVLVLCYLMSLFMFWFNIISIIFVIVKVMKTSNSKTNEFKMRNKDFPALPGTQMQMHDAANTATTRIDSNQKWSNTTIGSKLFNKLDMDKLINDNSSESHLDTDFHLNGSTVPKPGVQTSIDGLLDTIFIFIFIFIN